MSKHTPGPWRWVDQGGWFALMAANGVRVADDGSAGDEYGREVDPEDKGESGANARLLSAAPDLLTELALARSTIHSLQGAMTGAFFQDQLDRIDAAIEKATGEQP